MTAPAAPLGPWKYPTPTQYLLYDIWMLDEFLKSINKRLLINSGAIICTFYETVYFIRKINKWKIMANISHISFDERELVFLFENKRWLWNSI